MEAISSLLILIGTLAMPVSFVSVLWPLKRLGLPTPKRSVLAVVLSFCVALTGGALVPDVPDEPSAQSLNQAAPQAEATDTPEEPADSSEQASEPVLQTQEPPREVEHGLVQGTMWVRVLGEDLIDELRFAALDVGLNPGFMYPARGAVVIGVVPVNRLTLDDMLTVLPFLCEATAGRWAAYGQVRILNVMHTLGWRFNRWSDACTNPTLPMPGISMVLKEWETDLLWRMALPVDSVGYGK